MAQLPSYDMRVTKVELHESDLLRGRRNLVKATLMGHEGVEMTLECSDPDLTHKLQRPGKRFTLIFVEQPDLPEEKKNKQLSPLDIQVQNLEYNRKLQ